MILLVGGQDERRLGVVERASDILHLEFGQPARVENDSGRIAGQGCPRERVHLMDLDRSPNLGPQLVSARVARRAPVGLKSRTSALSHQVLSGKRRPISAQKLSSAARSRSRR